MAPTPSLVASAAVENSPVPMTVVSEDASKITVEFYLDDFESLCRDASRASGMDTFYRKRNDARYHADLALAAMDTVSDEDSTDEDIGAALTSLRASLTEARRALES